MVFFQNVENQNINDFNLDKIFENKYINFNLFF